MIKTIVFDIGHVLIGFDWKSYLNRLFAERLSAGEIAIVAKATFGSAYWQCLDSDAMEIQDAFNAMQLLAPGYESYVMEAMDKIDACGERKDYAIPWVEEMKARGLQVLYLSNCSKHLTEKLGSVIDFIPHMNGGVTSWEEKCVKPDEKIFRILFERFNLIPSECVFIDDTEVNIETARKLGMHAVLFLGYEQTHRIVNLIIEQQNVCLESNKIKDMHTIKEMCDYAAGKYADRNAFVQYRGNAEPLEITYKELAEKAKSLRAGLLAEGISGSHIAVIGETSIEWMILYLAVVSGCGVLVPIDKEHDPETIVKQINTADVEYIFCSDQCREKINDALPKCRSVKRVFRLAYSDMPKTNPQPEGIPVDPDKTCLIIYTSGTTGANKGVMLTNRNILTVICGCNMLMKYPQSSLSILPINHAYELHAHILLSMYFGTTVYINDDMKYVIRNLRKSNVEMICAVPMVAEFLADRMKKAMKNNITDTEEKIRYSVCGNLKMMICGGAALKQETEEFLNNIGIVVYTGYGMTECSPVLAVNPIERLKRGSVGRVLPTVRMRVADKNTDGYGELQVSGDSIMKGYYKDPESTAASFTEDGWFKTGDIGYIDKDEYVYIKGRKKNLIILSNGENVVPEEIEQHLYQTIPCIKECIVYADDCAPGLTAEVYLDPEYCLKNGIDNTAFKKQYIQECINDFNAHTSGYNRIYDIVVRESEFEKNSVQKIRRF